MQRNQSWPTPKRLYNLFIRNKFYDPCPLNDEPIEDGLKTDWKEKTYINPPYCNIKPWVQKAIQQAAKGKTIWMLLPSRTGMQWFQDLIKAGSMIGFIKGRVHYGDTKNSPPFDSIIVRVGKGWTFPQFQCLTMDELFEHLKECERINFF